MSHPSQAERRVCRLRWAALGFAAALVASTATACSGGSSGYGTPDEVNLRVGVIDSVGVVPFDIGVSPAQHSFSDAGLTVTVQKFAKESDEIAALSGGRIDVAYGEYSQFLSVHSDFAISGDIRVISEAYDAAPNTIALLVPKGAPEPAPATALQACKSVSVAVTSKFSPEFLALSSWLNSRRTPIDINCIGVKEIANPIEAIAAVKAHTVAAAVLQEPYVTTAEVDDGLSVAEDMASGDASQMPLDGYFATRDFTVRFPKTTRIFGAVMAKLQAAAGQRAGLEGMLNSQTGADPLITSTMQIGTFPSVVLGAKLDIVIRLMDNAGTLSGTLTGLTLAQLSGSASMH